MYTSYSKIDDRFGFSTGGTFHCAYGKTRTYITASIITMLSVFALIIINLVYLFIEMQKAPGAAMSQIYDVVNGLLTGIHTGTAGSSTVFLNIGFAIIGTAFGLLLLLISFIAFLIVIATMRMGQTYKFRADEQTFTVEYPEKIGTVLTIEYDYITGLQYEEWSFMFAPKCLDITVQTKQGDFLFRVVHTPLSKANGITETPFNIIRERIGLAGEDEAVLINYDAVEEKKPKFM